MRGFTAGGKEQPDVAMNLFVAECAPIHPDREEFRYYILLGLLASCVDHWREEVRQMPPGNLCSGRILAEPQQRLGGELLTLVPSI